MIFPASLARIGLGILLSVAATLGAAVPKENPELPAGDKAPSTSRVVMLPPIFVEESRVSAPEWRYAKLPQMEFLSCCDNVTTEQLIGRIHQLNQRLEVFLPAQFRVKLTVPVTYVFYGETQQPVDLKEMVAALPHPLAPPGAPPVTAEALTVRYLPNFRFWEQDELAVFFVLKDDAVGAGNIYLSPAYIRHVMENRTPALPRWFIDGMMALYQDSSVEVDPIYSGFSRSGGTMSYGPQLSGPKLPSGSALVRLPRWMFGFPTTVLFNKDRHWKSNLQPLSDLFATPPPRGDGLPGADTNGIDQTVEANRRYIRWWSQSALFIHWALHRGEGDARAAFWKFVEQASVEPVTEKMFEQYFGLNYAETEQALIKYLPAAVQTAVQLDSHDSSEMPPVDLHIASNAEIGRIKGNLERLEIAYVRAKYPELTPKYLAQARHTLRQAYDHGARDPGLLESLGLCECDAGNDPAALPFLEAAVQAGAERPRVFYELARIKYQSLVAANSAAKFSSRQTSGLLELLFSARMQSPPLPQVYELIAGVWLQSTLSPTRDNLAVLDEGLRLYPENLRLIYFTAVLNASHGFSDQAVALINLGLKLAPEGPDRTRLLKLQSAMAAAPVKGA
jgi:hypothetical protein